MIDLSKMLISHRHISGTGHLLREELCHRQTLMRHQEPEKWQSWVSFLDTFNKVKPLES